MRVLVVLAVAAVSTAGAQRIANARAESVRPSAAASSGQSSPTRDGRCADVLALDPAASPKLHVGTQSYSQTLDLCDHEVVLTFDDGPSPATTPRILRALKDAGVHATFFLIGRNTHRHPQLARQEFEEGHTVAHHSNTHPSFTLRGFDEASAETDIQEGIAEDERAIYGAEATPLHPHVPFFRFPGFADTPSLLAYLDGRDIAVFGSDLWAGDWIPTTPDEERTRVMKVLESRPRHNGIILFHDTHPSTAAMLPALLRELKDKGYRVVQLVYARGAPSPLLTQPRRGEPETVQILARLRPPIEAGRHHLAEHEGREPLSHSRKGELR